MFEEHILTEEEKEEIIKDYIYLRREIFGTIILSDNYLSPNLFVRNFIKDTVMDKLQYLRQEPIFEEDDLPF